jgi:hypothetical protein
MGAGYTQGQSAMETLLLELCTVLGFCLEPQHVARLLEMPADDVDGFARAVFEAEGFEEPYDKSHWRAVTGLTAKHFSRMRSEPLT